MNHTTHTEEFRQNLYIKMDIMKPYQLDFQKTAIYLGIQLFYWADKSQALFFRDYAYIFIN